MLIYEKTIEEQRKLFGTMSSIPSEDDLPLVYTNGENEILEEAPSLNDTYLDNGKGGIIVKSTGEELKVFIDKTNIIPGDGSAPAPTSWDEVVSQISEGVFSMLPGFTLTIEDNSILGNIEMKLIGIDKDELTSGGVAKTTWMNTTVLNQKGLVSRDMELVLEDWLENTLLPTLPDAIKNNVKPVNKVTTMYDMDSDSLYQQVSSKKMWPLSAREVNFTTGSSSIISHIETEGCIYSDIFDGTANSILWYNSSGKPALVWSRTMLPVIGSNLAAVMLGAGFYAQNASSTNGVIFGFCI